MITDKKLSKCKADLSQQVSSVSEGICSSEARLAIYSPFVFFITRKYHLSQPSKGHLSTHYNSNIPPAQVTSLLIPEHNTVSLK